MNPYGRYKEAEKMISAGREIEAFEIYNKLGNFMNSSEKKEPVKEEKCDSCIGKCGDRGCA